MKSSKGEGTKIAQAAKDLNVTSVTIRRYISEFNIETTADENGIKVLPEVSMEELHEIRRLKEDGLTNPKVLETLEEMRTKRASEPKKAKTEPKKTAKRITEPVKKEPAKKAVERKTAKKEEIAAVAEEEEEAKEEQEEDEAPRPRAKAARIMRKPEPVAEVEVSEPAEEEEDGAAADIASDGRSKHSLTCQTCGKSFEHMNPRLRDCLDCYRAKRKERRRGGDKHKTVIQHPIAQQVANKQQARAQSDELPMGVAFDVSPTPAVPAREATPLPLSSKRINPLAGMHRAPVRNYRKAIEETRQITANLKRRLERPDLPENERRWLEQIYAYQLILHQGWRHLAEYKAGGQPIRDSGDRERGERLDRPDRGDRPERGDRFDRGDRPERGDRFDRADRPARLDRSDRSDRSDRPDRSERLDRADKPDRLDRPDRPDRDRGDR